MPVIPVLEVAISLALLYLFFSQVISSIFEIWAVAVNKRGKYLRYYLNQALNSGSDKNWAELVYRHPTVDMVAQKNTRSPAYVPSSVFVKAIVDLVIDEVRGHKFVDTSMLTGPVIDPQTGDLVYKKTGDLVYKVEEPTGTSLANFKAGLEKIKEGDFKALMRTLLVNAQGCTTCTGPEGDEKVFVEFIHGLAVWYDGYMERVSGWYKRNIRWRLFVVGLLVAVFCNLDSLHVASYLWTHSAERQRIVAYATIQAADSNNVRRLLRIPSPADNAGARAALKRYAVRVDSLTTALQELGFPIGWSLTSGAALKDSSQLPKTFLHFVPSTTVQLPASPPTTRLNKADTTALTTTKQPDKPDAAQPADQKGVAAKAPEAKKPDAKVPPSKPASSGPALAWHQPAHYLRYQRRVDTTTYRGLKLRRAFWTRTVVDSITGARQPRLILAPEPAPNWWDRTRTWFKRLPEQITLLKVLGWLLTAAALSVGAPFWFETLGRFVNMRNVGVRPPSALTTPAKEPS